MEPKLWKAVLAALSTTKLETGDVMIDAGGNDGTTAKMLANRFPNQTIMTVEPITSNIKEIHRKTFAFPVLMRRVKVVHGGLGAENGFSNYAATLDDRLGSIGTQTGTIQLYDNLKAVKQRKVFPVYTVDTLVGDNRLAFAHIDVEGSEIEALQGAVRTIARDKPVITLETFPKSNQTKHKLLLEHMEGLEYECTLLDEVCGWGDCRNLICTT